MIINDLLKIRWLQSGIMVLVFLLLAAPLHAKKIRYQIHGTSDEINKNILSRLKIVDKQISSQSSTTVKKELIVSNVEKAMQPFGYFNPRVRLSIASSKVINIDITQGPAVTISAVEIKIKGPGHQQQSFKDWAKNFPLKPGMPLLIEKYNQAKQELFSIAEKNGFLKPKLIKSEILINKLHHSARIVIFFDSGPLYYFGKVSINPTSLNPELINRYIQFKPGQPYSSQRLLQLQDALSNSGYFQAITVKPQLNQATATRHVPINIQLNVKPSQSYTIGGGYGTDTGVRGTLGWSMVPANENGHKFQALIQGSAIQNTVQAQYTIPGKNPINQQYNLSATVYNLDYPNSESKAAQLKAAYLIHKSTWQRTMGLTALYERYTINSTPKRDSFFLYPFFNWKSLHADDPLFAKKGYSIAVNLSAASQDIGSKTNFAQAQTDLKAAYTLWDITRLYGRVSAGATEVGNILDLPPSLQFYTGGAQTVRGYEYQSLGPGKYLLVASAELQQRVYKKWYVIGFYDAGNAFNQRPMALQRSYGGGLMWVSPIGAIRAGLARAVDRPSKPLRFYFSMGPDL